MQSLVNLTLLASNTSLLWSHKFFENKTFGICPTPHPTPLSWSAQKMTPPPSFLVSPQYQTNLGELSMDRKIAKRFYCYIEIVDVAYFLKEVSKDNTGGIGEAISKEKIFPLGGGHKMICSLKSLVHFFQI